MSGKGGRAEPSAACRGQGTTSTTCRGRGQPLQSEWDRKTPSAAFGVRVGRHSLQNGGGGHSQQHAGSMQLGIFTQWSPGRGFSTESIWSETGSLFNVI